MSRRFFSTPNTPGIAPVASLTPYAGSGDPAGGAWLLADGRLIDRTVHAAFFAAVGHAYNGGVDPGSNMVRIPDRRGRASVGADNMGTAQGAAGRVPNSNRARGQSGGSERHQLSTAEMPSHTHSTLYNGTMAINAGTTWTAPYFTAAGATGAAGGDGAHNNMQPYEVDSWLVRVL